MDVYLGTASVEIRRYLLMEFVMAVLMERLKAVSKVDMKVEMMVGKEVELLAEQLAEQWAALSVGEIAGMMELLTAG